jgi:metallophosphoesterase (TIGR00282 family)
MNKILFLGDISGRSGRKIVKQCLKELVEKYTPSLIIANIENASGGLGVDLKCIKEIQNCGVNLLTSGNHIWSRKEIFPYLENESAKIIRPANYPDGAPGKGFTIYELPDGTKLGVLNIIGRVFIGDLTDCPFKAADKIITANLSTSDHIFVDFHAEATSEKVAMGYYLDGRVSAVVGTHTHVQTADERILPKGTAFITDVGMCGPHDSIIGADIEPILKRFTTGLPNKFESQKGRGQLNAVLIELSNEKNKANSITRINLVES